MFQQGICSRPRGALYSVPSFANTKRLTWLFQRRFGEFVPIWPLFQWDVLLDQYWNSIRREMILRLSNLEHFISCRSITRVNGASFPARGSWLSRDALKPRMTSIHSIQYWTKNAPEATRGSFLPPVALFGPVGPISMYARKALSRSQRSWESWFSVSTLELACFSGSGSCQSGDQHDRTGKRFSGRPNGADVSVTHRLA